MGQCPYFKRTHTHVLRSNGVQGQNSQIVWGKNTTILQSCCHLKKKKKVLWSKYRTRNLKPRPHQDDQKKRPRPPAGFLSTNLTSGNLHVHSFLYSNTPLHLPRPKEALWQSLTFFINNCDELSSCSSQFPKSGHANPNSTFITKFYPWPCTLFLSPVHVNGPLFSPFIYSWPLNNVEVSLRGAGVYV